MKNWSRVPDGRLTPRRTGRLIVGRNVTSTSISMTVGRKLTAPASTAVPTKDSSKELGVTSYQLYFTSYQYLWR
jgi:hypothetical protein